MGIRDQPTSPRSPWQNGYAERLIGSIRRECLDHVVVLGECHLRHLLLSYMKYYNGARTHLSLEKDAPFSRAVERAGQILCRPHSLRAAPPICPDLIFDRHRSKNQHLRDFRLRSIFDLFDSIGQKRKSRPCGCLLCPGERTSSGCLGMSEKCQ